MAARKKTRDDDSPNQCPVQAAVLHAPGDEVMIEHAVAAASAVKYHSDQGSSPGRGNRCKLFSISTICWNIQIGSASNGLSGFGCMERRRWRSAPDLTAMVDSEK